MATQLWICDFCGSYSDESKNSVEKHEERCDQNPINTDEFEEEAEVISEDHE